MTRARGGVFPASMARSRGSPATRRRTGPPVGDKVRAALAVMGHVLVDGREISSGGSQAIVRLPRGYAAGSDPRKDGMAAGN